ncbi:MAG: FHA domain-containing protein [Bdellovibrionales bacterium]|nr:FHA domain-containing protein [Bdellovibrionales bacterium]
MEIQSDIHYQMFELKPIDADLKVPAGIFPKGRILIGRSESCDLVIDQEAISAVHAVLEIFEDHALIYDMNSTNGTYVNDEKVIRKEIPLNTAFRLANIEFKFIKYLALDHALPVLDSLEPEKGSASPKVLPTNAPSISDKMPSIVHPLSSDPRAEFSEYIFEDRQDLFPIFKYEMSRQAVEVIVLFKDQVFSIDYLSEGKSTYYVSGVADAVDDLEFPFLKREEKFPFIQIKKDLTIVHTIPGFGVFHLSDTKKDSGHQGATMDLRGQDLVRLQKNDLQIFVRNVIAPPRILSAPILNRDIQFQKYVLSFLLAVVVLSVGINFIKLPPVFDHFESGPSYLAQILWRDNVPTSAFKVPVSGFSAARESAKPMGSVQAFRSHDFPASLNPSLTKATPVLTRRIAPAAIVLGALNPAVIRKILKNRSAQFKNCYRQGASGDVNLSFTIGSSGHVSGAGLTSYSQLSNDSQKCSLNVLKAITFPKPTGGGNVEVKQTLSFSSK